MITKCRHSSFSVAFTDPRVAPTIVKAVLESRARKRCFLLAWCFMPDHTHVLLASRKEGARPVGALPQAGRPGALSSFVAGWANSAAHLVNRALGRRGPLWQEGF